MSRESFTIVLGVITLVTPWLGIPTLWKAYIATGTGVALIATGLLLRRAAYHRRIDAGNGERKLDSFVESDPFSQNE